MFPAKIFTPDGVQTMLQGGDQIQIELIDQTLSIKALRKELGQNLCLFAPSGKDEILIPNVSAEIGEVVHLLAGILLELGTRETRRWYDATRGTIDIVAA